MKLELLILILSIVVAGLVVWCISASYYRKTIDKLKEENCFLKSQNSINQNLINELKLEFAEIAKNAINTQQEILLSQHSTDLKSKIELFKAEEITPINNLLKDFKTTIDEYKKSHTTDTLEVKKAIETAEKYAKAFTSDQNTKGELGEDLLEQLLISANLVENIHYTKQFVTEKGKPDFVIHLSNDNHIIVDSKVILKNYIEYTQADYDETFKKNFINDLTLCINNLAKRNYETIENLSQPGFILMYIPIEACVNLIYTDNDFRKIVELANSKNIIITGTSSMLVSLRLINQLWAANMQTQNVKNIIATGERLYNNINLHAQGLQNIQLALDKAVDIIKKEINRFTAKNKGSIFKEAQILRDYGILSDKNLQKNGNNIPEEFLENNIEQEIIND